MSHAPQRTTTKRAYSAALIQANAPSTPPSTSTSVAAERNFSGSGGSVGLPMPERQPRTSSELGEAISRSPLSHLMSSSRSEDWKQKLVQHDIRVTRLEEKQTELEQLCQKLSGGFPDLWRLVEEQCRRTEAHEARLEDWVRKAKAEVVLRSHVWGEDNKMLKTKLGEVEQKFEEKLTQSPMQTPVPVDSPRSSGRLPEVPLLLEDKDAGFPAVNPKEFQRLVEDVQALDVRLRTGINDLTESLGKSLGDMRAEVAADAGRLEMRVERKLEPVVADVERRLRDMAFDPTGALEDIRRHIDETSGALDTAVAGLRQGFEGLEQSLESVREAAESSRKQVDIDRDGAKAQHEHILQTLALHQAEREQVLFKFGEHQAERETAKLEREQLLQTLKDHQAHTVKGEAELKKMADRLDEACAGLSNSAKDSDEQMEFLRAAVLKHERLLSAVRGSSGGGTGATDGSCGPWDSHQQRGRPETPRPLASAETGHMLQEIKGLREYVDVCMARVDCVSLSGSGAQQQQLQQLQQQQQQQLLLQQQLLPQQIVLSELGGVPVSDLLQSQERRLAELEVLVARSTHETKEAVRTIKLSMSPANNSGHAVQACFSRGRDGSLAQGDAAGISTSKLSMRVQACEAAVSTLSLELAGVRQELFPVVKIVRDWEELAIRMPNAVVVPGGAVLEEPAAEKPPPSSQHQCAKCGAQLTWDDCEAGCYEHGWKCENFAKCKSSSVQNRWRWHCEHLHDYCGRCVATSGRS